MFNQRKAVKGKKHKAQKRSPLQESEIAKATKGQVTIGSGRGNQKGDVRVKGLTLIEAKCTEHDSFRVTRKMIEKIESEAALSPGELPVLQVELMGSPVKRTLKVALMPVSDLYDLIERASNNG